MGRVTFFASAVLACFLGFTSCGRVTGVLCRDDVRYAVPEYYRPQEYIVSWRVDGCSVRFSTTLVASEEKGVNMEEFRRFAAQRGERGTKRFRHCTVYPLTKGIVDIASIRVVRVPEGGGDTVDLSSNFMVKYFSYREYIMDNYERGGGPDVDAHLLSEADTAQYKYVLDAEFRIDTKALGGVPKMAGEGGKLSVIIRMVDGSMLPEAKRAEGK